jgi:hypothetical protein
MDFPLAPSNVNVISPYIKNALDLRWDNPALLTDNSIFDVLGVNVYRTFDSEFGHFVKLNDNPIQATFYRDQVQLNLVVDEDVSSSFITRGNDPNSSWVFRVKNYPVMQHTGTTEMVVAARSGDVQVKIDGVTVPAFRVNGQDGFITLISSPVFNPTTQRLEPPVLPTPTSVVTCTYRYVINYLISEMSQRVFYRLTTVSAQNGKLVETPVESVTSASPQQMEQLDYIWREAIRRNRWILEQGGERAKVFLIKHVGLRCPCFIEEKGQPLNDCIRCFGTGFIGGFDGPYDMLIAPDDQKKQKRQTEMGRNLMHTWETWTGPSPMLSQRDFITRQNGDRYTIGAVSIPSSRGMVLQQHFSINYMDQKDIRYKVPVTGTESLVFPQTRLQSNGSNVYPEITEKPTIPEEREERGRSVVWENITY